MRWLAGTLAIADTVVPLWIAVVTGAFGFAGIVVTGWFSYVAATRSKQLRQNGNKPLDQGGTLADAIARIEATVAAIDRRGLANSEHIASLRGRIDQLTADLGGRRP